MTRVIILYQSKSSDPKFNDVQHLPLYSEGDDAWAGGGYYFWDSHIQLAHWWGVSHYRKKYFVAQAQIDYLPSCLDLHDNPEHQDKMIRVYERLVQEYPDKINTIGSAIEFLKSTEVFEYDAIRFSVVNSQGASSRTKKYTARMLATKPIINRAEQYVDLRPPIQICLIRADSLNLRDYKLLCTCKKRA